MQYEKLSIACTSSNNSTFFSDHPRWETRDQRNERAYAEALAEYQRAWPTPAESPGGPPPAVAFLANTQTLEDKVRGSADIVLSLSCRNVHRPAKLLIRFSKDGHPVQSVSEMYRDPSGNFEIVESVACLDKDDASPVTVHVPSSLVRADTRKLKAEVAVLSADNDLLEHSKLIDVHFPKLKGDEGTTTAKVTIEPPLNSPADLIAAKPRLSPDAPQSGVPDSSNALQPVASDVRPLNQPDSSKSAESLAPSVPHPAVTGEARQLLQTRSASENVISADVAQPYLGAESDGSPTTPHDGVIISAVAPGGPAYLGGIREGDFITAIDGVYVTTAEQLLNEIRRHRAGDRMTVRYRRGASISDVSVILQPTPKTPRAESATVDTVK